MKRIWKIVSIALICGALTVPQIEARGRNNNNQRTQRTERSGNTSSRSNSGQRPGGNNSSRPSSNSQNQSRPSGQNQGRPNSGNQGRPTGNNQQRPGGNTQRPGGNNYNGGSQRPNNSRPSNSPSHAPRRGHVTRPHCPPTRPYHRPTPPPSFRPHSGCPVLRGILGITFGTTLNISIDYLNRHGYSVYGYGNDVVYLRNVNQYNYLWPDATLYYGVSGLTGSQFMYSTNYYDMTRYNMVYNTLMSQYGSPVSVQNITNGVVATWWGYDNQYVSLEFRPIYTNNGQLRYFTTLSFGI